MVYERFYGGDGRFLEEWRCITCGEVVDEVILENRRWVTGEPKRKKSSAKTGHEEGGERDRQASGTDYGRDLL